MSGGLPTGSSSGPTDGSSARLVLRDYWRSSASYRVRIGAALKGLPLTTVAVDLRTGAHLSGDLGEVNPQRLLPVLETEEGALTQSLAILEYLDDLHPQRPLLDRDPLTRARQRAMAQVIACDVHPVCNLRVLKALRAQGCDEAAVRAWMHQWMHAGFEALEAHATTLGIEARTEAADADGAGDAADADGAAPRYLGGTQPMLPDVVLVPQMYNARRFELDLAPYPRLVAVTARCEALPAFESAAPRDV